MQKLLNEWRKYLKEANSTHLNYSRELLMKNKKIKSLINKNRSKIKIVNFWATWCGPCKKEFPWFKKVIDDINRMPEHKDSILFIPISPATGGDIGTGESDIRHWRPSWPDRTALGGGGKGTPFVYTKPNQAGVVFPLTLLFIDNEEVGGAMHGAFKSEEQFREYMYKHLDIKKHPTQKQPTATKSTAKTGETVTDLEYYIWPFIKKIKNKKFGDAAKQIEKIYDHVQTITNESLKRRTAKRYKDSIAKHIAVEARSGGWNVTADKGVTEWLWSTTKDMSIVRPYILLYAAMTGGNLNAVIRKYEDMTKDHKESLKGN